MKTLSFMLVLVLSFNVMFASDDKYLEAMQKNIQVVYTAQTVVDLQSVVNTFDRIGNAEKTKWEPFYYESFGYVMIANKTAELVKKDSYLDLAEGALQKAKEVAPNESEIMALQGFIQMLRISVDPAARGAQYSGMSMQSLGKAIGMNRENPRALALMAQMQYGTAQFFHASITEACDTASKAIEKFETFKSDNPLAPRWGKDMTVELQDKCK